MTTTAMYSVLQEYFGYSEFRPGQQTVIEQVLAQRDCLVLMPTGGGKSLCFQIPALLTQGVCVVISPLIALMQDQVSQLQSLSLKARYLNGTLARSEVQQVYGELHRGELQFLYIAPERLFRSDLLQRLQQLPVSLLAIDEAHCISQWGHDFRPEYSQLTILKQYLPNTPIMALTATADHATRHDIMQQLQLHDPYLCTTSFDRPNIRYSLIEKLHPLQQIVQYLKAHDEESGIIYCSSRNKVDQLQQQLVDKGFKAGKYHAGMTASERQKAQTLFNQDDIYIMVATIAFGMGINKPNIRYVIHHDLPKNIESYYQETGRAGRDGSNAEAILLFDASEIPRTKQWLLSVTEESRQTIELQKFNAMAAFAEAQTCRRIVLLNYFNEQIDKPCNNCDICLDPPQQFDATVDAQKALSCVYRLNNRFGLHHVVAVLRGSKSAKILQYQHEKLSTYGIGEEQSAEYWLSIIRQLLHRGLLRQNFTQQGCLQLTEIARPILRGEVPLMLAKPRFSKQQKNMPQVHVEHDEILLSKLKQLRKDIAKKLEQPPYVIFNDATLIEMASKQPQNSREFLTINGVGPQKLERFGQQFLEVLCV